MKALLRCSWMIGVLLVGLSSTSWSQSDLENILKQYESESAKGYIQPMADLFGANMNAGLYHSAAIPQTGFSLQIDLIGMGSSVGDDQKTYTLDLPASFTQRTMKAPTIFGPKSTQVTDPNGFQFKPSDGIIDASLFPLAVPQLTIGNIYGTQAMVRFIATPSFSDEKFPKTTLWGAGLRHSISQYLGESAPLDIAAGFFYSSFTVGDIIDFSGLSIGAQASKSFSVLNLYGGLAWEKSTMNLSYKPSATNASAVDIDLDGDNAFRFTVGAGLKLAVFNIFADANFGSITNFSGGIGFGF